MQKRFGLTLVESVVVVGIVTFSLSLTLPPSSKASRKARSVLCVNTLKNAGRAWAMYLDDHDGYFPTGWIGNTQTSTFWNHPTTGIYPYLRNAQDDLMCAEVRGTIYSVQDGALVLNNIPAPWWAWGKWAVDAGMASPDVFRGDYGSYGINYYVGNHPTDSKYWRRADAEGAGNIPIFAECFWPSSAANHYDSPPRYEGEFGGGTGDMKRFLVNRHQGYTTILFMDFSVRQVPLKRLWTLKWHRQFNTINNRYNHPNAWWPDWMKNLPE